MKNVTDSFVPLPLDHWPSVGSFGLNTDILATNPINLIVVLGVLIFFGKGVLSDLLDNRKQRILNTIRNSEELRGGAIEQLEKARARLRKIEIEADQYRVNESFDRERKILALMNSTYQYLEQKENSQNERIRFEQEKTLNQVRQRFFQQALERALETLNSRLTNELHLRIISANIDMLRTIKEITD